MDLNATIDIIIKDLSDIKEILDDLKQYKGVPALEVELAKSKCRGVMDIIALMKNMDQKIVYIKEEKSEPVLDKIPEEQKQPEKHLSTQTEKPLPEPAPVKTEEKPVIEREPELQAETIKEFIPPAAKIQEHAIIADQFANRPESYNEKLASMKHEDDVLEIIKARHVENLTEAIGINDKFLFIREIFNGDQESYDQALTKLDSALSLEEAQTTILNYAGENRDNEAFKVFLSILKRKFTSNE